MTQEEGRINLFRMILVVLLLVAGGAFAYTVMRPATTEVSTFQECAQAGYPVRETAPRVCTTPQGESFEEPSERAR